MRRLSSFRKVILSAAALSAAAAGPASSEAPYDVPPKWLGVAPPPGYSDAYWTTVDEEQRIVVLVRPRYTGGEDTLAWLESEAAFAKTDGARTGRVGAERYGGRVWYYVDWKDPGAGTRGRRYFLETGPGELVEVSLSAVDAVFRAADASQFDGFLASFRTGAAGPADGRKQEALLLPAK